LICIPLGLGSAIFLAEYAPRNFFTRIIHFFVELLAGIPSIILGIFGFTFFAVEFGWHPRSLLGGAICLAFMTLPWNIRVAEEAIRAVSEDFKAASYALGATKLQTIRRVVLESAAPGILTGTLLGFGAAFGEAAVAIFTAGDPYASWPSTTNLWKFLTGYDIPTLPAWIYGAFRGPGVSYGVKEQNVAFSGALVLVAIFLAVTITALVVRNRLSKKLAKA
jgi:phosphate transport system permease protein